MVLHLYLCYLIIISQTILNMKSILVGIDFTDKSTNALKMAIQMAIRHQSKIILFHSVAHHSIIDRTGKQIIGSDIMQENFEKTEMSVNEIKVKLQSQYPKICFEKSIKNDSIINGLNDTIVEENVDLVICGTSGNQNFKQVLLGSVSYQILTEAKCSVLMVPEKCQKYSFDRILVPVRVLEDLSEKIDLSVIIAKKNNAFINLLGICNEDDLFKIKNAYKSVKKTLAVNSQEYISQFVLTNDKATQISKISKDHLADLIIMNYKDENSWKSLFSENFFKQIINYTELPLYFLKNITNQNKDTDTKSVGIDITLPCPG